MLSSSQQIARVSVILLLVAAIISLVASYFCSRLGLIAMALGASVAEVVVWPYCHMRLGRQVGVPLLLGSQGCVNCISMICVFMLYNESGLGVMLALLIVAIAAGASNLALCMRSTYDAFISGDILDTYMSCVMWFIVILSIGSLVFTE